MCARARANACSNSTSLPTLRIMVSSDISFRRILIAFASVYFCKVTSVYFNDDRFCRKRRLGWLVVKERFITNISGL